MEKQIVAIYHKDCIDGTASAAVVLRKFSNAQLYPLAHSYTTEDISPIIEATDKEADVYLVDCALGLQEFLNNGNLVTVIDHHAGSREEVATLAAENSRLTFIFDNEKSGSSLAWSYFFENEPLPELIKYVEDSDLWRWQYGDDSRYVNSYLSMFRNDPAMMLEFIGGDLTQIKANGKLISEYADERIASLIEIEPNKISIGGYTVSAFNITDYESACGNLLSEKLNQAVAMYTIKGSEVKISFRSKDTNEPSSLELATILGGGGHRNAAGASVSLQQFISIIQN